MGLIYKRGKNFKELNSNMKAQRCMLSCWNKSRVRFGRHRRTARSLYCRTEAGWARPRLPFRQFSDSHLHIGSTQSATRWKSIVFNLH